MNYAYRRPKYRYGKKSASRFFAARFLHIIKNCPLGYTAFGFSLFSLLNGKRTTPTCLTGNPRCSFPSAHSLGYFHAVSTFCDTLPTDRFSSPNRIVPVSKSRKIKTVHLSPIRVNVVSTGQSGSSFVVFGSLLSRFLLQWYSREIPNRYRNLPPNYSFSKKSIQKIQFLFTNSISYAILFISIKIKKDGIL